MSRENIVSHFGIKDLKNSLEQKKALSRTFTGELIDLLDPRPDQIHIEDIAHNLSMNCRFAGSTRKFYSVAEHSVNVYALCARTEFALEALLHDASEAYLSDINGNLKHCPKLEGYRAIEKNFEYVIACRFGLRQEASRKTVKTADYKMLELEGYQLIKGWNGGAAVGEMATIDFDLACLSPFEAEILFKMRAKNLLK